MHHEQSKSLASWLSRLLQLCLEGDKLLQRRFHHSSSHSCLTMGWKPSFSQWLAWTRNLIFLDRWQYRVWIPPLVHTCVLSKRSRPLISAACYWPFSWTYGQHLCHISPTLHHPAKLLWKHFYLGRLLCLFRSITYNTFSWIHNSFFWLFACALAICLNLIQLLSVGKYC